jgi:hypothetical protein
MAIFNRSTYVYRRLISTSGYFNIYIYTHLLGALFLLNFLLMNLRKIKNIYIYIFKTENRKRIVSYCGSSNTAIKTYKVDSSTKK